MIENRKSSILNAQVDRQQIVSEIRRTAAQNGGKPPSEKVFSEATGITRSDWFPKLWPRFSEAVKEAGFEPRQFSIEKSYEDAQLLEKYAMLAQRLKNLPTDKDIRHQRACGEDIPNSKTYESRFGSKHKLISRLFAWCDSHPEMREVHGFCATYLANTKELQPSTPAALGAEMGYVYLFRMGKYLKIGSTNDLLRRGREIKTLLPEKCEVIHTFRTDDPSGIEAYWHRRFASKRCEGEWFELTAKEISAFKMRRNFM